jgi:diketogulonate reductase-like aldo/keto reductase
MAKKYEKSPAQVMLAWCLNHDIVVIPKSVHEGRILENANIFFDLADEDMETLDTLDMQTRLVKGGPFV